MSFWLKRFALQRGTGMIAIVNVLMIVDRRIMAHTNMLSAIATHGSNTPLEGPGEFFK